MNSEATIFLFLGSCSLVSTKTYPRVCLIVALIASSIIFHIRAIELRKSAKFITTGFLEPLIVLAGTTSAYALNSIIHPDISVTCARSEESITRVTMKAPESRDGSRPTKVLNIFHGE